MSKDDSPRLAPAKPPAPLATEELRRRCDPESLPFASTAELEPIHGIVGQDTAVDALRFGMEIHAPGQNIFVRGLSGTGRMTIIQRLLEEIRPLCPEARDRCYVYNFQQPDRPRLITLPWGQAQTFRRRVGELADFIRDDLEAALSTAGIQERRAALDQETQTRIDALVQPLDQAARQAGLTLVTVQVGPVAQAGLFPLVDGKPVPPEQWQQLVEAGTVSKDEDARIREQQAIYQKQLQSLLGEINNIRRQHSEAARTLREQAVRSILEAFAQRLLSEFPLDAVRGFLDDVIADVAEHHQQPQEQAPPPDTRRYRANPILAHAGPQCCPIIIENVPTMTNLLGTAERKLDRQGVSQPDHHLITAGALLRADGGYLIVEARDLLGEPGAWKVLLRTLRTGRLEIVPPELALPWSGVSLKPEPIDLNVKVILLGDTDVYYFLDAHDQDFSSLFKVLADFDSTIPRDAQGIDQYGAVLARLVHNENMLHFERSAVAALVEHGARIASRQDRLTTRFGRLADIAREAAFLATKRTAREVSADDVAQAIRASKQRASLPSRRFRDLLADGTIRVTTSGGRVGQINGLAVMQAGPLVSGFPARITATIGPGSAGIINIEREAQLSGAIHTKGFYILGGLLRHLLRTMHPLAFNASLAFEQSYGGIDGDSASTAEICCLLSALTEIPLRQDLAMTGAIDQHGNVLAIGAVNEKIEGFFDTCLDAGLTDTQGVIIPQANVRDLMLRPDVVQACEQGKFHIHAVQHVGAALELFTGVQAGEANANGEYPDDTLLGVAMQRAFEFWLKASPNLMPMTQDDPAEDAAEDAAHAPAKRRKPRKKTSKKTGKKSPGKSR